MTMVSDSLKSSLPSPVFRGIHDRCLGSERRFIAPCNLFLSKTLKTQMSSLQIDFSELKFRRKKCSKEWLKYGLQFRWLNGDRDQSMETLLCLTGQDLHLVRNPHATKRLSIGVASTNLDCLNTLEFHTPFCCCALKDAASSVIYKNSSSTEVRKQHRGSNNSIERCLNVSNQLPRRVLSTTAAATADSDQTFPSQNEGGEKAIPRKPSPEVEPADVVQAQLKALRERDMATVFEFASPKNKAYTGPLSRFTEMIQGIAYNVMIGHVSADILSSLFISPSRFQQRILIKGASGNQATFSWSLSKQEEGLFQGCWMTDSVHRDE